MNLSPDDLKKLAAARALELVRPGMRLGLGTGSTAKHFVDLLGARVANGLDVLCVATSEATQAQALALGIPMSTLDETPELDLTVDGADEIDPRSAADQGRRRGASAREDRGGGLGPHGRHRRRQQAGRPARPLSAADRGRALRARGDAPGRRGRDRRRRSGGRTRAAPAARTARCWSPMAGITCSTPISAPSTQPDRLATALNAVPGVVEHGLFLGLATGAVLASADGLRLMGETD